MRLTLLHRRFSLRSWLFVTVSLVAIFCIAQNMPIVDDRADDPITISRMSLRRRHAAAYVEGSPLDSGPGASNNNPAGRSVEDDGTFYDGLTFGGRKKGESSMFYKSKVAEGPQGGKFKTVLETDANENVQPLGKVDRTILPNANISKGSLSLPSITDLMPHLRGVDAALRPAQSFPNATVRSGVRIVIGVPTVSRQKSDYLYGTLQSLIFGMSLEERNQTLIVVMIGDVDEDSAKPLSDRLSALATDFYEYLHSGLLHVIVPPKEWYPPDIRSIPSTLGDPPERMYWRTKQNLDYMFLMLFSRPLGDYYLQVEDDVLVKAGYIRKIEAAIQLKRDADWFVIDFSSLGFIGKLLRAKDLDYLTTYIALLHRYKPVDWVLDSVFMDRYCFPFSTPKDCHKAFKTYRLRGPTLFQHVGVQSSLTGKTQKLKERNFGETMSFNPHRDNPPATLNTSLDEYQEYSIEHLYIGVSPFWSSRPPKAGDYIRVEFSPPVTLKGLLIRSGNAEHPLDVVDERTSVSWRTEGESDFQSLSSFTNRGVFRWTFENPTLVTSLSIDFNANYTNWVLLSEFFVS